jgi:nitrite reductase/ring-hydroxylating ferredoxin subunit
VGVVHAAANSTAITLYAGSLLARARRRTVLGKALGFAGLAVVTVGGMLGGEISYRQAGGASHTEEVPHLVQPGWQDLMAVDALGAGKPVRVLLGEVPVLAVRDADRICVLADKCSHMSGPLSEGTIQDGCVTCPWHGSVFRLGDGTVVHGPATADQPVFGTRVRDGMVQVRLPGAG